MAKDCEYQCPNCQHDLSFINIKDQFIRGIHNTTLQTDILAKSTTLTNLEAIIKHAEAFETAPHDQSKMKDSITTEVMRAKTSEYKKNQRSRYTTQESRSNIQHPFIPPFRRNRCPGCGSTSHGHKDRSSTCPAWGKACLHCNTPNHFAKVCRQKYTTNIREIAEEEEEIVASVHLVDDTYTTVAAVNNIQLIPAELTPILPHPKEPRKPETVLIFPDSGAGICLAGPQHLKSIGIQKEELTPCYKKVTAVGGSRGWV